MDITSVLNQPATSSRCNRIEGNAASTSAVCEQGGSESVSLPTPSPERTQLQQDWEPKSAKKRTAWTARGYALPLQSEPEVCSRRPFSFHSGIEAIDSDSSVDPLGLRRHSRHGSTNSASIELGGPRSSLPSRRLQQSRYELTIVLFLLPYQ